MPVLPDDEWHRRQQVSISKGHNFSVITNHLSSLYRL
jgi:hypothetical protein